MIPIKKKPNAASCENFRTVSLKALVPQKHCYGSQLWEEKKWKEKL